HDRDLNPLGHGLRERLGHVLDDLGFDPQSTAARERLPGEFQHHPFPSGIVHGGFGARRFVHGLWPPLSSPSGTGTPSAPASGEHTTVREPTRIHRRCRGDLSPAPPSRQYPDRKSTRLNSSHVSISYAVFCLKKKKTKQHRQLK